MESENDRTLFADLARKLGDDAVSIAIGVNGLNLTLEVMNNAFKVAFMNDARNADDPRTSDEIIEDARKWNGCFVEEEMFWPLYIDDGNGMTAAEIESEASLVDKSFMALVDKCEHFKREFAGIRLSHMKVAPVYGHLIPDYCKIDGMFVDQDGLSLLIKISRK